MRDCQGPRDGRPAGRSGNGPVAVVQVHEGLGVRGGYSEFAHEARLEQRVEPARRFHGIVLNVIQRVCGPLNPRCAKYLRETPMRARASLVQPVTSFGTSAYAFSFFMLFWPKRTRRSASAAVYRVRKRSGLYEVPPLT